MQQYESSLWFDCSLLQRNKLQTQSIQILKKSLNWRFSFQNYNSRNWIVLIIYHEKNQNNKSNEQHCIVSNTMNKWWWFKQKLIHCLHSNQMLMNQKIVFDESDVQKKNEHRECWMNRETHNKCQTLNETIHTKNSRILRQHTDSTLEWFEKSKITTESKNEWFCVSQLLKLLDETDERDERTYDPYEATTDEIAQRSHLWNLDLKQSERHWRINICEAKKHFDVFQMREVVQNKTTIEKDMQQANHHEKKIWQRVFQQFIEQSIRVISA